METLFFLAMGLVVSITVVCVLSAKYLDASRLAREQQTKNCSRALLEDAEF